MNKKIIKFLTIIPLSLSSFFLPITNDIATKISNNLATKQQSKIDQKITNSSFQKSPIPVNAQAAPSWKIPIQDNFAISLYTLCKNVISMFREIPSIVGTSNPFANALPDPNSTTNPTSFNTWLVNVLNGQNQPNQAPNTHLLSVAQYMRYTLYAGKDTSNLSLNIQVTPDTTTVPGITINKLEMTTNIPPISTNPQNKLLWYNEILPANIGDDLTLTLNYDASYYSIQAVLFTLLQAIESINLPNTSFYKYYVQIFSDLDTYLNGAYTHQKLTEVFNECNSEIPTTDPSFSTTNVQKTQINCYATNNWDGNNISWWNYKGSIAVPYNSVNIFFITDFVQKFLFNIITRGTSGNHYSLDDSANILTNILNNFFGCYIAYTYDGSNRNNPLKANSNYTYILKQNTLNLSKINFNNQNTFSSIIQKDFETTYTNPTLGAVSIQKLHDSTEGHILAYFSSFIKQQIYNSQTMETKLETQITFTGSFLILPPNTIPDAISNLITSESNSTYNPDQFYLFPRFLTKVNPSDAAKNYIRTNIANDSNKLALKYNLADDKIGQYFNFYLNSIYIFNTNQFKVVNWSEVTSIIFASILSAIVLAYIIFWAQRHLRYHTLWKKSEKTTSLAKKERKLNEIN